jgi:ubiquinone/menaquinone biosynthesis C-methylase UbiE
MGLLDKLFRKKAAADLTKIRRSFEESAADEEHFPSTIDPRIDHVRQIAAHFGDLAGKRVLDVGSGKGRFSRVYQEQQPEAAFVCFDLALAMLRQAAPGLERCAGSMTALPFADGSFDCAFATESLEHAVDIETAVAEMCRVVKPGGRIAIIDKNAEHWGRFDCPAWEKWFRREELEKLLRRHCREVDSRFISYWEDVAPDGLFILWRATR